jgi:hypothetical protein
MSEKERNEAIKRTAELFENEVEKKLYLHMIENGTSWENFVNVVIKSNGIVGVGLISLADELKEIVYKKIRG